MIRLLPVFLILTTISGCRGDAVDVQTADAVPVRLDSRNAEKILRFALGSYSDEVDPVEAGLLIADGGAFLINPQKLAEYARASLEDADGNGAIDRDELWTMLDATYYRAREAPETLAALQDEFGNSESTGDWFTVEVSGAMTAVRRRVRIPRETLQTALLSYTEERGIRYPAGTLIIGEHLADDGATVLETTVKRNRSDGFWDFFVYDEEGNLTSSTATEPRPLQAPTQCTGCHLGRRQFEPEKSFPQSVADGPHGPRAYFVPESWRNADVAVRFQEHARRSGDVLGVYGTLYISKLLAEREAGEVPSVRDRDILSQLGY